MITQNIHFEINGTTVNEHISSASLSMTVGRGYNVATLESDVPYPLGASVSMALGDRSFAGFVYRVGRTRANAYTIECRSDTARLTTPFDPDQEVFEPARTATELCQLFADRSGITIDYRSAELHFGRSFQRSGTMLDSLLAIARVTGSSVVCTDDNTLTIAPRDVPETTNATLISDSDIIDFSADTGSLESFGISELLISSDSAEVTTQQKRTLEVDSCTGQFVLYAVPVDGVAFANGVSGSEATTLMIEEESMQDSVESLELKAEIVSVESVKVNGFELSGYSFEDCFLMFDTAVTGRVSVSYEGSVIRGQVAPDVTPAGLWWLVRGDHNGESFSEQGFLECDNRACDLLPCATDSESVACVFMPDRRNYVEGFSFWVYGGTPVARSVGTDLSITHTGESYTATLDAECERFVGAAPRQTRVALAGEPTAVVALHTEATRTPTWVVDGRYLVFPDDYGKVKVAYTLDTERFDVSGDDSPNKVKLEVANACDGVGGVEYWKSYDLKGFDKYDLSSYPCVLGEPVPVDVAGSLRVLPHQAYGQTVTVDVLGDYTVDVFGYIFPVPQRNGTYRIDCSNIVHGGEISLRVNV